MKYLAAILLCTVIILTGCESKQEVTDEQLEQIIETINEIKERRKTLFDYEVDPQDSFVENRMTFVKYTGKNNTFKDACAVMEDLCSPEVTEKQMHEMHMYSFDGELYMHAAAGLPSYAKIDDISAVTVLCVKDNIVALSIKRYYFMSNDKDNYIVSKYVVELKNGRAYVLGYEEDYSYAVNTRKN